MHMYSKKGGFFGGAGIVGAQVPLGAGLAFAAQYKTPPGEPTPIGVGMYGDGAANQGQIWEAANMSSLWKLPMIFCIENNQYGMGTSKDRSSSNPKYYTMGSHIPGFRMDGMNVLMVREGFKFAKDWCSKGNGPIYVEVDTYRYHGHSMSDPGTTYRNRDEISTMRTARDPIEYVKNLMINHNLADPAELKNIEKEIRKEVQDALKNAKNGTQPLPTELYSDIFVDETPSYIRMPNKTQSIGSIE
jgi:pyruvate dehydrogenase E1 component alpha subunit